MNSKNSDLVLGRWYELTVVQQLANIGNHVIEAIARKNQECLQRMQQELEQALKFFDLTLEDNRWNFYRLREIKTARMMVCDFLVGDNEYKSDEKFLNDYFTQFAIAARANR